MWKQLKHLARHSAIYGIGNIAVSLLSFLLVPLYTHYLTTTEFGVYSLVIIVYGLLSLAVDLGLSNSIARYYFDDEKSPEQRVAHRKTLVSTAFIVSAFTSCSFGLICYFSAGWVAGRVFGVEAFGSYLKVVAATLLCYGLATAPMIYLRITERSLAFTLITSLQVFLFLALNIVMVAGLKLGVIGIFYSLLASTAVYALFAIAAVARDLAREVDLALVRELFKFGLPFVPVMLLKWVVDFSDRYLLDHYSTVSEVGIYSLGYKFGQSMAFVVTAFTLGWAPIRFQMLSLDKPEVVYGRVATLYVAIGALVWLALSVFSSEVVFVTSPAEFHRAAAFIPPVAFGYLLYGLFVLSVTGAGVARRTGSLPLVVLAAAVLNVGLNLVWIPRFGPMGAAWATLLAYAAMVAGGLYFSQRLYPIIYQYRICLLLLGSAAALAWAAGRLSTASGFVTVGVKLAILTAYCAIVIVSGALSKGEIARAIEIASAASPRFARASLSAWASRLQGSHIPSKAGAGQV